MSALVKILTALKFLTSRIGVCGNVGLIAGAIAGFFIFMLDFIHDGLGLNNSSAAYLSLILSGLSWLVVLFMLTIFVRLTLASIAFPSLVNCLITCFLTVFLSKWMNAYAFAYLIGIIVGALVGMVLCRLNFLLSKLFNS